jgi:hypothetical protein
VAQLPHTPGDAATCTTNQICQVCKEEVAPALGHTPGAEATCTDPQICTVCKTELVAPLGHKYGNWEVIKQPTEEEHGVQQRTCTVCGYLQQEEIVMPVSSKGGEGSASGLPALTEGDYDLEIDVRASSDLYNIKGTNEGYQIELFITKDGEIVGTYDQTRMVNLTLAIPDNIDENDLKLYRVVDNVLTLIDPSEYTVNGRMVSIRTELRVELVFHNDEVATKSEAGVPWWIWLLIALAVLVIVAIIILIAKKRSHDDDEAVVADGYDDTETKRQLARQERRLRNLEQQSHPTDSDGFYDDVDKK